MAYSNVTAKKLKWFSQSYFDPVAFLDGLVPIESNAFQTQAGRDAVRNYLQSSLVSGPTRAERFPSGRFLACTAMAPLTDMWAAVLQATDTKNRITEDEKADRVSTAEALNSVKRVDDATVAIRSSLDQLKAALRDGSGVFDQADFEEATGLVWTAPSGGAGK